MSQPWLQGFTGFTLYLQNVCLNLQSWHCNLNELTKDLFGLRKQPSFFAPCPSGFSRETPPPLGPRAKKDGCFRRLRSFGKWAFDSFCFFLRASKKCWENSWDHYPGKNLQCHGVNRGCLWWKSMSLMTLSYTSWYTIPQPLQKISISMQNWKLQVNGVGQKMASQWNARLVLMMIGVLRRW